MEGLVGESGGLRNGDTGLDWVVGSRVCELTNGIGTR